MLSVYTANPAVDKLTVSRTIHQAYRRRGRRTGNAEPYHELRRRVLGPPKPGLLMPCDGTHYHRAAHPACVNLQAAATDNWPCDVCRPNMYMPPGASP